MPSPNADIIAALQQVSVLISTTNEILLNILGAELKCIDCNTKTIAVVTQANCPVCNAPLHSHMGPYARRSDGLLVHNHHKSFADNAET